MKPALPLLLASLIRRETPQELSHDRYIVTVKQMLDLNNTINVSNPTFGLLANSQAAPGMGTVTDATCLQLAIADCAFTNAKASNNLGGMVASLIYRALERNTAGVGLASEQCTTYTPKNKELAIFHQHQDPAAPGAQANNKATVLELARQIALIGGDPIDALYSGTFQPGEVDSTDVSGNACNTSDCIFTDNLLVRDASEAEIYDYVGKCVETVTSTVGAGVRSIQAFNQGVITYIEEISVPTGGYTIFDVTNSGSRTGTDTAVFTTSTTAATTPGGSTARQNPTVTTTKQQPIPTTPPSPAPIVAGLINSITHLGAHLSVTQVANGVYHAGTVLRAPPAVGANVPKFTVRIHVMAGWENHGTGWILTNVAKLRYLQFPSTLQPPMPGHRVGNVPGLAT